MFRALCRSARVPAVIVVVLMAFFSGAAGLDGVLGRLLDAMVSKIEMIERGRVHSFGSASIPLWLETGSASERTSGWIDQVVAREIIKCPRLDADELRADLQSHLDDAYVEVFIYPRPDFGVIAGWTRTLDYRIVRIHTDFTVEFSTEPSDHSELVQQQARRQVERRFGVALTQQGQFPIEGQTIELNIRAIIYDAVFLFLGSVALVGWWPRPRADVTEDSSAV